MDPEIVIAMYRPAEGRSSELEALIAEHLPTLRRLGLVTDRPPVLCRASDGCYLEIFEWRSGAAAREAHEHPEVSRIWEAMEAVAEFPALGSLPEAQRRFPHFRPVSLG